MTLFLILFVIAQRFHTSSAIKFYNKLLSSIINIIVRIKTCDIILYMASHTQLVHAFMIVVNSVLAKRKVTITMHYMYYLLT